MNIISNLVKVSRSISTVSIKDSALNSFVKVASQINLPSRKYSNYTKVDMRFVQFRRNNETSSRLGVIAENGAKLVDLTAEYGLPNDMIEFIKSNPSLNDLEEKLKSAQWENVTDDILLLAPVTNPEKIVCIGLNYLGHCQEQKKEAPKEPMFFSKFASTLTGPTGDVILHKISTVHFKIDCT